MHRFLIRPFGPCSAVRSFLTLSLLVLPAVSYTWPAADEATLAERTAERVAAGKHAAKQIACDVCRERLLSLVPASGEEEIVTAFFVDGGLADAVANVSTLCGMRSLARLFKSKKLEIATHSNGSASLRVAEAMPFYEEINTSEMFFHWKSLALQHACTETFRRDGDSIASAAEAQFLRSEGTATLKVEEAAKFACKRSKMCKAAEKMKKANSEL